MSKNFNDKEYWNNFYQDLIERGVTFPPSPFAQWLIDSGLFNGKKNLVEMGCGNGRDSVFFAANNLNITAIDQCSNTTAILNEMENIESYSGDFTSLDDLDEPADIIYSRFTLHSIDDEEENRTLRWVYKNLAEKGLFTVEVRTVKDPIFGKGVDKGNNIWFYNNHHRRFVEADVFKAKLEKLGFDIISFVEDKGFAKYKDQDPIVLRAIVKK